MHTALGWDCCSERALSSAALLACDSFSALYCMQRVTKFSIFSRAEFTPGRAKGIDYMFAGENRRLKKSVTPPTSTEAPSSEFDCLKSIELVVSS